MLDRHLRFAVLASQTCIKLEKSKIKKRFFFLFLKKINKKEKKEGRKPMCIWSKATLKPRRLWNQLQESKASLAVAAGQRRDGKGEQDHCRTSESFVFYFGCSRSLCFCFCWPRMLRTLRFPLSREELRRRSRWRLVTRSHSHSALTANAAPRTGDLQIAKPRPQPLPARF